MLQVPSVLPDALAIPLNPFPCPCFVMMWMMPTSPSVLYRAEGVVRISRSSIVPAGICSRACAPSRGLGLPSMYTRKWPLPRRVTLPSASMATEGMVFSTSKAVPPLAARLVLAAMRRRSRRYITCLFSPVTETLFIHEVLMLSF